MLSANVLRYGREDEPPPRRTLHAGSLTATLQNGELRWIRLGAREVLRRVYMAVRDENWGTVPSVITNYQMEDDGSAFAISYDCEHKQDEIHFRGHATIRGDRSGSIRWTMDGQALTTFRRNRIGWCVLHPLAECVGAPCTLEHMDGSVEESAFPRLIAPDQPFLGLRAITQTLSPGVRARVEFAGEEFETEDQRNWTDASFKTYSTPLRFAYPATIEAGTKVHQSVDLAIECAREEIGANVGPDDAVEIRVDVHRRSPLPRLGLAIASHGESLDARSIERLRRLRLAHLRVDLALEKREWRATAQQPVEQSMLLGVPLEIMLQMPPAEHGAVEELASITKGRVVRWLIDGALPIAARESLRNLSGGEVLVGTNAHFAELNRHRPDMRGASGIWFGLNPQVHAFDEDTLVENLAGQREAVESARAICADRPVAVSPVTLKPRFNPDATAPDRSSRLAELPPQVDPRQMSLFGACWTLGSLKYLAEAGAHTVTYFETTGWRGVMERAAGSQSARFSSLAGGVFPLYHVLAAAGEFAGGSVMRTESDTPLAADAVALCDGARWRILVANFSREARWVRLLGAMFAGPLLLRRLDEHSAEWAMQQPEAWRDAASETIDSRDGRLSLELNSYAIAILDGNCEEAPR